MIQPGTNVQTSRICEESAEPCSAASRFRLIPDSYFAHLKQWDPGLDQLLYFQSLISEETVEQTRTAAARRAD
jgi:hypothetical protein